MRNNMIVAERRETFRSWFLSDFFEKCLDDVWLALGNRRASIQIMLTFFAWIFCWPAMSQEHRLLVPDTAWQSMTILDQQDREVVDTVYGIGDPHGVAGDPRRPLAYIAEGIANKVKIVNTLTRTVIGSVTVGNYANGVVASNDGAYLYVTNTNDSTVSMIDTGTNKIIATIPVGNGPSAVAIGISDAKLYVSSTRSGAISIVDTQLRQTVSSIQIGGYTRAIALSPDGSTLYVANATNRNVSVVDIAQRRVVRTLSIGAAAAHIAIDPQGRRLFVGTVGVSNGDFVYVIDIASLGIVDSAAVNGQLEGLSISGDGTEVYAIANSINTFPRGRLIIFDANHLSHLQTIQIGAQIRAFGNFVVNMPDRAMLVALVEELQAEIEAVSSIDPGKAKRLKSLFIRISDDLEFDRPGIAGLCANFDNIVFFLRQAWLDGQLSGDQFNRAKAQAGAIALRCGCMIEATGKDVFLQTNF